MRNVVFALVVGLGLAGGAAAQNEVELESANNNIANTASLQRGAKYFVNYCLGCHSAKYVRYNRLGEDLQLSNRQLIDNLMFTGERPFDVMAVAMKPQDAARWFTIAPPDLSLIARSRGPDWIYTYLRSFYIDSERSTGVNNVVLHNTNMPHVLWQLQGTQRAVFRTDERGVQVFERFEQVRPGELDERAYDEVVRDIVNFLDYIGEPMKRERQQLGVRVIGFLLVFLLISYMLKKEIWKDVT